MMEVPSIKFDIRVGLESILGKFILVDLLGASLPGFLISSEEGLGSFLSLLTLVEGLSLPRTRWEPPGLVCCAACREEQAVAARRGVGGCP